MQALSHSSPENFARKFVQADNFDAFYAEVMGVVEATATYLDGEGRRARANFEKPLDILYSRTSMQLTTQLMQLAAFAMILRELKGSRTTLEQAINDISSKNIDRLKEIDLSELSSLPGSIIELVYSGNCLRERVLSIYYGLRSDEGTHAAVNNEVHQRIALLRQVF